MASLVPGLGDALASVFNGWLERKQIDKWVSLIIQLGASYAVTFNGVCGGALLAGRNPLTSIGMGMLSGAGVMVVVWAKSPVTKGANLIVPTDTLTQTQAELGETAAVKGGNPKS